MYFNFWIYLQPIVPVLMMGMCDWWMEVQHLRAELKCVTMVAMAQYVMTDGMPWMQQLCADSWDTTLQVWWSTRRIVFVLRSITFCVIAMYSVVTPVKKSYFGAASSIPIHLDNVMCSGDELHLFNCSSLPIGLHNCQHSEDAGVIYGGTCAVRICVLKSCAHNHVFLRSLYFWYCETSVGWRWCFLWRQWCICSILVQRWANQR